MANWLKVDKISEAHIQQVRMLMNDSDTDRAVRETRRFLCTYFMHTIGLGRTVSKIAQSLVQKKSSQEREIEQAMTTMVLML